jgi:hypothetical protein
MPANLMQNTEATIHLLSGSASTAGHDRLCVDTFGGHFYTPDDLAGQDSGLWVICSVWARRRRVSTNSHILKSLHCPVLWLAASCLLMLSGCADALWSGTSDDQLDPWPEPVVIVIGESSSEMIDVCHIESATASNSVAPLDAQEPQRISHQAAKPAVDDARRLDIGHDSTGLVNQVRHESTAHESMRQAQALFAIQPEIDSQREQAANGSVVKSLPFIHHPAKSPLKPWKYLVLHHTATTSGDVESIHQSHLKNKDRSGNRWLGIGYHFVIGNGDGMPDGEIAPTFRWHQQLPGAHAGNKEFNDCGIGIVLVGNFAKKPPTEAQVSATKRLVSDLANEFVIESSCIIGHGTVRATECPGRYFPMDVVKKGLRIGHEGQPDAEPPHATPPGKTAAATPRRTKGSNSQ